MRIIFFGTPKASEEVLSTLITSGMEIIAVVTSPDRPKGRGLVLTPSPVAEMAVKHGIKLFRPEKASDPGFIEEIRGLKIDIGVVVAYGKLLKKQLLDIPKFGFINLHTSLLPRYRGASPIQSALQNGEQDTGVTIMRINESLDSGDIISQKIVPILPEDNSETLFAKLFEEGTLLLLNSLNDIERSGIKGRKQDEALATKCTVIKKEDGALDFSDTAINIHNKIRAYYNWPGAFSFINGKKVKLLRSKIDDKWSMASDPGMVIDVIKGLGIYVMTGKDILVINMIQPENSRVMTSDEFVSGYRIKPGDKFTSS